MSDPNLIRTTCYSARVQAAAEALGMPPLSSADDVLKMVINKTKRSTVEDAKRLVMAALEAYDTPSQPSADMTARR